MINCKRRLWGNEWIFFSFRNKKVDQLFPSPSPLLSSYRQGCWERWGRCRWGRQPSPCSGKFSGVPLLGGGQHPRHPGDWRPPPAPPQHSVVVTVQYWLWWLHLLGKTHLELYFIWNFLKGLHVSHHFLINKSETRLKHQPDTTPHHTTGPHNDKTRLLHNFNLVIGVCPQGSQC